MDATVTPHEGAAPSEATLLKVSGVAKRFGGVQALDGVDFQVERGCVAGLIGPNGAGKSSLFNVITGVVRPDRGSVTYAGRDITGRALADLAQSGIARTFQTARGFSSMTALENLLVVAPSSRETLLHAFLPRRRQVGSDEQRAREILDRLGLGPLADAPYEKLGVGHLRLLEIGRHLMRDAALFLLDEPTAGIAPAMQEHLAQVIRELNEGGITVLIVEHNLKFVFGLATTVAVMVSGRMICQASPEEVQRHPAVIAAYLGGGATE